MPDHALPLYLFTLPLKAIPKGRPRVYRGHAITPPETRKFEADVKRLLKLRGPVPVLDELRVEFEFGFTRPKRTRFNYPPRYDLDNLVKSVSDACNGLLWVDDSQISEIVAKKKWSDSTDYIRVKVYV
jgi:crossover junction endodeoxyribonuclease RusA